MKLVLITVVIAAALVAAKQTSALERAELLSSCSEVAAPAGEETVWLACRAGRLDGQPDLSLKSCQPRGAARSFEYWSCPSRISRGRGTG